MRLVRHLLVVMSAAVAMVGCADKDPLSSKAQNEPAPAMLTVSHAVAGTCELPGCNPGFRDGEQVHIGGEDNDVVTDGVVLFADPVIEALVRDIVGIPDADLTVEDVAAIRTLNAGQGVTSLGGVEHLVALEWLNASYGSVVDLTPLSELENLNHVDISYTDVTDLSPLEGMPNIEFLNLGGLQSLDLVDMDRVIHSLPALRSLWLQSMGLTDVAFLADLKELTTLHLNNNNLADITPLFSLTNLTTFGLANSSSTDLASVERLVTSLPELRSLTLWGMLDDVTFLGELTQLTSLTVGRNASDGLGFSDLTPLSGLSSLERLDFRKNMVSDLSALEAMAELTYVNADGNLVTDLSSLVDNAGIGAGDRVTVVDNPLTSQAETEQIPALEARGVDVTF